MRNGKLRQTANARRREDSREEDLFAPPQKSQRTPRENREGETILCSAFSSVSCVTSMAVPLLLFFASAFAPSRLRGLLVVCWIPLLIGCANDTATRRNLKAGYDALEQKQYDQALAAADTQLQEHPTGTGSAEALYLRGRVHEERLSSSPADAQSNLLAARSAYQQALQQRPAPVLEAHIRAGLGNVAYWQDDYPTAIDQWTAAFGKLDSDDTKSWVLYRIGISRQRMGQFHEADQIFARVQQAYPGSLPARRAMEHKGARAFHLQLATFANADSAERSSAALRKAGYLPLRVLDAKGRHIVRLGPFPSYQQAQVMRSRHTLTYPDAMIVP
jgi:TolA-binding protein